MLEKYVKYIKNNPEGYWFKRKLFGWGWFPVKWQGWLVILGFVAWIVLSAEYLLAEGRVIGCLVSLAVAVIILIAIGYCKGEKPKWQWGLPDKKDQNSEEL